MQRRVIFDFDDAIFISKTSKVNRIVAFAKWSSKIRFISKYSSKVAVCNNYLVNWVKQYNPNAVLLPTTIDRALGLPAREWLAPEPVRPAPRRRR